MESLMNNKYYEIFKLKEKDHLQNIFNIYQPYNEFKMSKIADSFKTKYQLASITVNELTEFKEIMNTNLKSKNYDSISTKVLIFQNETPICATSVIYLKRDLEGNLINDYLDFSKKLEPIFFSVFPQAGKTYVLLSYFTETKNTFSFLYNQFGKLTLKHQKVLITSLIFSYIENFYTSNQYWKSKKQNLRNILTSLFNETLEEANEELELNENVNYFK